MTEQQKVLYIALEKKIAELHNTALHDIEIFPAENLCEVYAVPFPGTVMTAPVWVCHSCKEGGDLTTKGIKEAKKCQ